MSLTIKVLDHGFVTLRNMSGPTRRIQKYGPDCDSTGMPMVRDREFDADDVDVANSARMSFNGQSIDRPYEAEMKLNRYLMLNKHMTPFESIEVWLEMKLPIFVARQFVRHRTASLNEVSGRYVTLPAEWYIPENVGGKVKDKKQGQEDNLDAMAQRQFKQALNRQCDSSYREYLYWMESGVAPEHARMFLHLNHYTHWIWKQDLRNLLGMLVLRDHSHAQIEAQMYAKAIIELLGPRIPGLMNLYQELMK